VPEGVVIANQDGDLGPGRSNLVVNGAGFITTFSGGATTNSGVINTGESFDHVILTFDQSAVAEGVDPTFRFFINGAEAGTGTAIPEAANGSWVIGANKILTTQFFNGIVDDVAIYGSRLDDPDGDGDSSDSKIAEHYKGFLSDSITVGSFGSSVTYLDSGQSAELNWLVSPELSSLTLDDGTGPIDVLAKTADGEGSIMVSPTATTTYTLIGVGSFGSESLEIVITVDEGAVINSFSSNVDQASPGSNVTLFWDVTNASSVTIDNEIGAVNAISGSVIVPLNKETTFTLTANNSQGPVTESVTIALADASLPVAHWRVGEAAGEKNGSVLIGEGGSSFDGLFVGTPSFDADDPAPVPGGSTASIVFDGARSWVDVSGYDGVGGDSARTLAFWFKGDLVQPNLNATLVSWGTGA
ncbi:MAG: LamG-like jellyroll fold domain-containing protein, partial [Akkermansiaceae bacterium]